MFKTKLVAAIAALALCLPAPQVEARNRTALVIGAAVLGAAIASSSNRSRSYDRYDSGSRYQQYGRSPYYQDQYQDQGYYYSNAYSGYSPRYASPYGYDQRLSRSSYDRYGYDGGTVAYHRSHDCSNHR